MQDIDFSQGTRRYCAPIAKEQSTSSRSAEPKKVPGFFFTPLLVTALLTFSLGIIAGVFLAKAKDIEKNIISRPDDTYFHSRNSRNQGKRKDTRGQLAGNLQNRLRPGSFTNISNPSLQEAPFLIKIGVYPSKKAQDTLRYLNLLPEFIRHEGKAYKCKNIKRATPFSSKQLGFTVPVPGMPQQENVLLGCFMDKSNAMSFLTKLLKAGAPEMQNARLFQIAD